MVTWQYNYNNGKPHRAAAEAVAKAGQKAAVNVKVISTKRRRRRQRRRRRRWQKNLTNYTNKKLPKRLSS